MVCPVYASTVAYTGQVTFYKVPEEHGYNYLAKMKIFYKKGKYELPKSGVSTTVFLVCFFKDINDLNKKEKKKQVSVITFLCTRAFYM